MMLKNCLPVLFVEMLCEDLNKSILTLLDGIGYAMSWIIGPVVTHDEVLEHFIAGEEFPWMDFKMVYGGANIVAIPKARKDEFKSENPFVQFIAIDIERDDGFRVPQYSICLRKDDCFPFEQEKGPACAELSHDRIDYWKYIE